MAELLTFSAEVVKVQTLTDHGLRLTLDLAEDEEAAAAKLMVYKRLGVVIKVTCVPEA